MRCDGGVNTRRAPQAALASSIAHSDDNEMGVGDASNGCTMSIRCCFANDDNDDGVSIVRLEAARAVTTHN